MIRRTLCLLSLGATLVGCADFASSDSRGAQGLNEGGELGSEASDDVETGELGDDDSDSDSDSDGADSDDFDRDDCKVEDGRIGTVGSSIQVGDSRVTFTSWTEKDDSPGEFVGFTFDVAGPAVVFKVKTGGEIHEGSGTSFEHPNGTSGAGVPAISHIDFCDNVDPDDGDDDSDGGDDGDDGDGDDECIDFEGEIETTPCNDADDDSIADEDEPGLGTDPNDADSDNDGLTDGEEVGETGTDPTVSDTDGGGVGDGAEVDGGSDPLDPADDVEACSGELCP